jgi:8-oxo-dGTP pyrophosphatase MutT (NUDIX family)
MNGNMVLIQARNEKLNHFGIVQYSGVGGLLKYNEDPYVGACRECKEEAGFTPLGRYKQLELADYSDIKIFCVEYAGEVITGPVSEYEHEVDKSADFTKFGDNVIVIPDTGHAWVPIQKILDYSNNKRTDEISALTKQCLEIILAGIDNIN